ncbi:MAG: sulfate/molybdate ABC transporter ATP-binding protein [Cyanobacteriota bacterium]
MGIRVSDVSKTFGSLKAIDNLSLDVETGSLVALLGPSGCGKSTLLRMIAGLENLDQGRIYINGADATALPVQKRNVGFVFQHFALFKHRSVRDTIGFGLELRRLSRQRIRETVDELLHLVQLQGYGDRYPSQLSGGQRQRVSLARALALKPDVLLLDEPFSALDAKVRKELRVWLRNLQEQTNVTTVIVTHDQEEAMEVADKIVVINDGRIEQIGSAADIYDHPASPFVMRFVGDVNELHPSQPGNGASPLFVRPHELELLDAPDSQSLPAIVRRLTTFGRDFQVELELDDGQRLLAQLNREQAQGRLDFFTSGQRTHVVLRGGRRF